MRSAVLIVDGDARTAALIKGTAPLTGSYGYDVRAVPDGARAVRWATEYRVDLIELAQGTPWPKVVPVDCRATRRFGGTGLGLAAAREIFRAHGAELKATSKPGQGSIFRFTLYLSDSPFAKPAGQA